MSSRKTIKTIRRGRAEGRLLGGNLSLIHSMTGTGYLPSFKGSIVFLEDIEEPVHKIDRMLNHLFQLNIFRQVKGFVIGRFTDGKGKRRSSDKSLREEVLLEYLKRLNVPAVLNFPIGHGKENLPVAFGRKAFLNAHDGELITRV
jgi:muramoyltetrapeptide carboxypeptidase